MIQKILDKIHASGKRYFANDNLSDIVSPDDVQVIQKELEKKFQELFTLMGIDYKNDHNTAGTSQRIAKMWMREVFRGRYEAPPKVTDFPNDKNYDGMLLVGPIELKSVCAHHFAEIVGHCYVGVMPGDRVIGLSKYARIVSWFARRPQIQEELTQQIAEFVNEKMNANGVAVYIKAKHHCMTHRGIEQNSDTMTSVVLGAFRDSHSLKQEFFDLIKLNEMK